MSDPHPEHTECPAINTVDLVPAQQQTGNLNVVRRAATTITNPENASLRGTITVPSRCTGGLA
jgi:hypothetical protein